MSSLPSSVVWLQIFIVWTGTVFSVAFTTFCALPSMLYIPSVVRLVEGFCRFPVSIHTDLYITCVSPQSFAAFICTLWSLIHSRKSLNPDSRISLFISLYYVCVFPCMLSLRSQNILVVSDTARSNSLVCFTSDNITLTEYFMYVKMIVYTVVIFIACSCCKSISSVAFCVTAWIKSYRCLLCILFPAPSSEYFRRSYYPNHQQRSLARRRTRQVQQFHRRYCQHISRFQPQPIRKYTLRRLHTPCRHLNKYSRCQQWTPTSHRSPIRRSSKTLHHTPPPGTIRDVSPAVTFPLITDNR